MSDKSFPNSPELATLAARNARKDGYGSRDGVHLSDLLRIFERHRRVFIASICTSLFLVIAYIAVTKPVFRADAQVLIDANPQQLFREQFAEVRSYLDSAQIESQMAILRSEQVALAVIKKMKLAVDLQADRLAPSPWSSGDPLSIEDRRKLEEAIAAFQGGLRVRRVGPSYVIEVSYFSSNPQRAADITNATAEAYIQFLVDSRMDAARQGSNWLEGRIDDLRLQMNAAALKVHEFKARRDYRISGSAEPSADQQRTQAAPRVVQNTLEELESTAQTYRKIYESYLQAFTESVQRQSYPVTNARVITRATTVKNSPKIFLLLLLGTLVGGAAGLALAVLREPSQFLPRRSMRLD